MKKAKKIAALTGGVAIVLMLLLVANSTVGNPISSGLAKKSVESYIAEKYSSLDLRTTDTKYNFKFGKYHTFVQSKTSKDTQFTIYTDWLGRVIGDDYEYEVANSFTTYRRIDQQLRDMGRTLFLDGMDYDFDFVSLGFFDDIDTEELELDMEFDVQNSQYPLTADVVLFSSNVSYEEIARVARDMESVLLRAKVPVHAYDIRIIPLADKPKNSEQGVSWVNDLSVSDFPTTLLGAEDLAKTMEDFEAARVAEVNKNDEKHKKPVN